MYIWIKFSLSIISGVEGETWRIDVFYVWRKRNLLTISLTIAFWILRFRGGGVAFVLISMSHGPSLIILRIWFWAGGSKTWIVFFISFGVPSRGLSVGVYGRRGMIVFFRENMSDADILLFIFKLLFNWVSIRVDFGEIDWFSVWGEDM